MRRLIILISAVLAPSAAAPWAAAPASAPRITITQHTALPLQVARMDLLRDPTRRLGLAEVRSPAIAQRFTPMPPGIPNLGTGRDAVWARFAVQNATAGPLPLVLALTDARTAHIAFWALDAAGQVIAQRRDGRFADAADRDRTHRWFLFDLPLAAGATATLYLQIESDTGRLLDLRLTDRLHLAMADRAAYGWLALFFGALLFMLAYNLLLLLQLRDPAYLWLCCVIAGAIIWAADREGLLTTVAWRVWPDWLSGIATGPAIAYIGIFMFPLAYLRLGQNAPRWAWLQRALAVAGASLPVLVLWSPQLAFGVNSALGAISAPVSLVAGLLVIRRWRRPAAWYLVSWLPMFLTMALLPLVNYHLLPALTSVWSIAYGGLLLLLLLLSVAQADRVNQLRREAEHARAALARNEHRLNWLVDERTRELAAARDRAETASRAKTRFLAHMSHELRTPLNAILGGVDLLRRSPRLHAGERDQCGLIQRGGRHLLRLIEELLDIAQIEHDRLRPVVTEVALGPLLDDLAAVTRRQAEAKGLTFGIQIAPDLPGRIRTDGRRMRQVLQNLLDNAVKYTDAGSVGLHAQPDTQAAAPDDDSLVLRFTVTDTGRGIAATDRERLFAPFEQYDHAQAGTGLGLTICRELAAVLGGELTLDSAPGRGSRFCFRLPARRAMATPDALATVSDAAPIIGYEGPRRRILVIDDSDVNLMFMSGLLQQLGFAADTAANAQAALALARRRTPELVIADLRMPKVCGYAAVWQLRDALGRADLPAIAASASPLPEPQDAFELGFDAFLIKPVEREPLCAALGACLGLRWVRADQRNADAVSADPGPALEPPPLPPPRMELDAALELVDAADWARLRDWCTEINDAVPECADFAARVRTLLDASDAEAAATALRRLLADSGQAPLPPAAHGLMTSDNQ